LFPIMKLQQCRLMEFIIEKGESMNSKSMNERTIENHLRYYKTYLVGIKNCEQQLEYIYPNITTKFGADNHGSFFYVVSDNTCNFALDRIEGKRALDLKEEINKYKIITSSIEKAVEQLQPQEKDFVMHRYFDCLPIHDVKTKLGYSEEKSVYRIRRHVLDKLLISLHNLLTFK
jgi:DNA-directed RNA polymerase specialized sigma subunit